MEHGPVIVDPLDPDGDLFNCIQQQPSLQLLEGGQGRIERCTNTQACLPWQGHMVDYCAAAPADHGAAELEGAPVLLLVHGFGAFGEQWRGQLAALAAAGYQVGPPCC